MHDEVAYYLIYNFERNIPIFNMKHDIYEFSLSLKILCFVSKGSLNIPEYRCLLIGRVQYLYTIEHAVVCGKHRIF